MMICIYIHALVCVIHNIEYNCINILTIYPWVLLTVVPLPKKQQPTFKISFKSTIKLSFLEIMKCNCKIQERIMIFVDTLQSFKVNLGLIEG